MREVCLVLAPRRMVKTFLVRLVVFERYIIKVSNKDQSFFVMDSENKKRTADELSANSQLTKVIRPLVIDNNSLELFFDQRNDNHCVEEITQQTMDADCRQVNQSGQLNQPFCQFLNCDQIDVQYYRVCFGDLPKLTCHEAPLSKNVFRLTTLEIVIRTTSRGK